MQLDPWTLLLQSVNFVILVLLLRWVLYRPVLAMVERREAALKASRDTADSALAEARVTAAAAVSEREALRREREAVLADARRAADSERATLVAKAQEESARLRDAQRATLEEERVQALAGLRRQATELSVAMARQILAHTATPPVTVSLLDDLLTGLEHRTPGERGSLSNGGGGIAVVTAVPLTPLQAGRAHDRLTTLFGPDMEVVFRSDSQLLAGAELHFHHAILRRSWADSLAVAREAIERNGHGATPAPVPALETDRTEADADARAVA